MSKYLAKMQALEEQVSNSKSIKKAVKFLKVRQSEDEMLDKLLELKLLQLQGKAEQLDEQLKQLEKERDFRREELNSMKLKRSLLESMQTKVEAMGAEAHANYMKVNLIKQSSAAKQELLLRKCEEIVRELDGDLDRTVKLLRANNVNVVIRNEFELNQTCMEIENINTSSKGEEKALTGKENNAPIVNQMSIQTEKGKQHFHRMEAEMKCL
ncbi:hypothetical protein U1Q18_015048 [Sarracenia purpurea var. burkii]